ncbi:MAG: phage terminase large subunit [Gammaproteobacteria bacterium]|nr:phage terminase large subunit [Gammaproteobacteria bacterium]
MSSHSVAFPGAKFWPFDPHPKQAAGLLLMQVESLLYGGAAGAAKSAWLLLAATAFCTVVGWDALVLRRTYADLSNPGGLMYEAQQWWLGQPGVRWEGTNHRFIFDGAGTLTFGHLSDGNAHLNYKGAAFTFIGIDEAGDIPDHQLVYMQSRLRKAADSPLPVQYRLTANPGGISHIHLKETYVDPPNTLEHAFLPGTLEDNPSLDQEEYDKRLAQLDPITRRQLRHGDWDAVATTDFFETEKLQVVDEVPNLPWRWVRSWDLAATKEEPGKNPDYTVGALIGHYRGQYCIADMRRFREPPATTMHLIETIARTDGNRIPVVIEQEGGASGKLAVANFARELSGYAVRGYPSLKDKMERAQAFAAATANELVCVLSAGWRPLLVGEMQAFGSVGVHDDIVDSVSQGINYFGQEKTAWVT